VGEEDDEVERRRVRPVEVLEHQQHGCRCGPLAEHVERSLEDAELRARRRRVDPHVGDPTQRVDERLIGQLGADEVHGPADEDLEPDGAGTPAQLGGEPRLADACLPRDEDDVAPALARCVQRPLELPELGHSSHEDLAAASAHRRQCRAGELPTPSAGLGA
jgi:hypothetical protein